jgi:hypothetical protein
MELLTKELRAKLPGIYATEGNPDAMVVCKFFLTASAWTWYAVEFDGEDTFFGLVEGDESEMGYFSLSELTDIRNRFNLSVERDIHFEPVLLKSLLKQPQA